MAKRNRSTKRRYRGGVAALKRNSGVRNIGLNVAPIELLATPTKINVNLQSSPVVAKRARIQAPGMISMAPNPFNIAHRETVHQETINMPGEMKHSKRSCNRTNCSRS
jgi:hypothetical protein